MLKELDHPNIGKVVEMYEDSKKIYFVNEMMYGGTIFQRLVREKSFSEAKAAKIIKQLVSAVAYLHSKGIVHGDIKPMNIHFRGVDDDIVKLIDFGTSRRIREKG
jgi:calcium-dependent protein kinase